MPITEKSIDSPEKMISFGESLAKDLSCGSIVFLRGDLGAGKTTLAKGIIQAFGYTGSICSPTYTLIHSYPTNPPIHHLDLYRLSDEEDYFQSGLADTDSTNSIWLVEWPDRALPALPKPTLSLSLSIKDGKHIVSSSLTDSAPKT